MRYTRALQAAIVLLSALAVLPVHAQTVQFDDTFTRADATSLGNSWLDAGSVYRITSNTATTVAAVTQGDAAGTALRPTAETLRDSEVVGKSRAFSTSTKDYIKVEARVQANGDAYVGELDLAYGASGAAWAIKTKQGTTFAVVGTQNGTFTPVAAHIYAVDLKATGVSPTTLVLNIIDKGTAGTGTTVIAGPFTVTDSTADLQATGQQGFLLGWYDQANGIQSGNPVLTEFTTYTFSAVAATSYTQGLSAASGAVGSPVTITYTPNGTTTAIVTPAVSGITGTFSPTTITLNNTVPVTIAFTPTSAGTATLTSTNNGTLTNPASVTYNAIAAAVYNMASAVLSSHFQQFATYITSSYAQWDSPGNYTLPLVFTGTSIVTAFDITPETTAAIAAGNYPTLKYSVDNAPWVTWTEAASLSITGLVAGTHTIQFAYVINSEAIDIWTTPVGVVRFTQVTLDGGATLATATVPTKTMCWHGDSTGRSAWNNYSTYADADGTFTAGYLAAQGLGAFFGNASFSHQGWSQGGPTGSNVPNFYTQANNAATTYNQYYNGVYRTVGGTGTGLFLLDCDYHFICQGQNGTTTSAQVQAFLGDYRTHTNNYIFLVVPFSGANRTPITAGFNAYQTATPDSKCFLIDLNLDSQPNGINWYSPNPSKFSGDDVHPNQWGHAQIASKLVQAVQAKLGGGSSRRVIH